MFKFFQIRKANETIKEHEECLVDSIEAYSILEEEYALLQEKYENLCKEDDTLREMYASLFSKLSSIDLQLKIIQVNLNPPVDDKGNILSFSGPKGYLNLVNQMVEMLRDQITDLLGLPKKEESDPKKVVLHKVEKDITEDLLKMSKESTTDNKHDDRIAWATVDPNHFHITDDN